MLMDTPAAQGIVDIVAANSAAGAPIMKSSAALYSSQGELDGLLVLYSDRLEWNELSGNSNMLTISMDALYGATLSPPGKYNFRSFEEASVTNLGVVESTHFTVYTIAAQEGGKRPLCDTWTFKAESKEESATWLSLLRYAIHPAPSRRPTNVLVFLNPVSGKHKSLKLFDTVVRPIFNIGSTQFTLKITESAGYASTFVRTQDLSEYTAVVAVSGDGLLYEIVNGLLARPDWAAHRDLPLGVIPTGTGNGLAKTLDCIWPEQAAVAIVKAQARPLDIMSTTLSTGEVKYWFLSATWAYLADVDIESESIRWAGAARLDVYAVMRLLSLRYYGGRLHYLPAADDEEEAQQALGDTGSACVNGSGTVAGASTAPAKSYGAPAPDSSALVPGDADRTDQGTDMPWGLPPHSFSSPLVRGSPEVPSDSFVAHTQPAVGLHPTLTADIQLPIREGSLPPRWRTIEGPFAKFTAANASWLSGTFLACPMGRFSDGAVDVVYAGVASKWQLLPYMVSPTRDNYMNSEGVKHVRARAFILEPTGLRTTSRNANYLMATQPPLSNGAGDDKARVGRRSQSLSLFSSLRAKSISRSTSVSSVSNSDGLQPQAPVPVRVRSQAYSSYHQQTIGRGSGLMVQGLDATAANDSPRAQSTAPANGGVALRPPSQAAFSLRSETALAAAVMQDPEPSAQPPALTKRVSGSLAATHEPLHEPHTDASAQSARETTPEDASDNECRMVGSDGIMVLDGEEIELGPIKIECLPSLLKVICPPWLCERRNTQVASAAAAAPKAPMHIAGTLSREGSALGFSAA
ncbi:hypothetical protein LPJ61_004218 [Coemansia biformis]|uniref:DAGKc domain-containing protein n=1 Tax=Coemansia biformis TaxID=1286918 RepID=A0A9W7Y9Q6_9FUNG|nr:hypothetical protein LPJ61_004218 [Coemansia biformis]